MASATISLSKTNGSGSYEVGYVPVINNGVTTGGLSYYATYTFTLTAPTKSITINFKTSMIGNNANYNFLVDSSAENIKDFTSDKTLTLGVGSSSKRSDKSFSFKIDRSFSAGTYYIHVAWASGDYNNFYLTSGSVDYSLITYTVSYNANSGSSAPSSQAKTYGTNLTLTSTKPTRTGYTFNNWNTKADGTGTTYKPGGTYNKNADLLLYAQWTINTLTIKMHVNGGVKASDAPTEMTISSNIALYNGKSQIVNYGSKVDLWNYNNSSWVKLTRPGYIVTSGKEFCTTADGSGTVFNQATSYDISKFADITTSSKTVTLYVNWKTGGIVHYSNGNQWIPCQVYYSDGTQWIHVMPYYSDGSQWIQCT